MSLVYGKAKLFLIVTAVGIALMILLSCSTKTNEESQSVTTAADQELLTQAKAVLAPIPQQIDNPDNPLTPEKIKLGKMLYFDTRISRSNTISCNSCHNLATYGVDNNVTAMGHGWTRGPRNSPTVLNAAGQVAQFWDGRAADVEEQAQGPIMNPIEMGGPDKSDHDLAVARIADIPEYKDMFIKAFPAGNSEINLKNIADAIAAYERTLMTPAPLDDFLQGKTDAMTEAEKKGLSTFISTGCTSCHNGTHVGGAMFQKFGLVKAPYWDYTGNKKVDKGKEAVSGNEADLYVFKVPTLRNIVHTYPYFHDGSVWDLQKAVEIMGETQLGRTLTSEQVDQIMTFMSALTGEVPESARTLPMLPPSPPQAPKPDDSVI